MRLIQRRLGLLFAAFLLMLVLGAGRAAWLGVVRADTLKKAAVTQQRATLQVPARRGSIVDRHGQELAVSQPATTITTTPYLVKDPVKTARRVARMLGLREDGILRQLSRRDTGFAYVARGVPASQARAVEKLNIAGLDFVPEYRRVYPRDWTASQLLGFVGDEGKGLMGLEYSLDGALRGQDGERRLVKDAMGDAISLRDPKPTVAGKRVQLTLDASLQDRTEDVLAEVGRVYQPRGATAIVMDPNDGSVLALANWPQVNANAPGAAPEYARMNRGVGATYEPGSTFKAFTVAGALEDEKVTPDTQFGIPPTFQLYDREIKDAEEHGYETLSVRQILEKSSNIGAVKIGMRLGKARFDHWVRAFGFGQKTGVDMPGEEQGIVPKLSQYTGFSIGNLPMGQGLSVTPMQMAAAYSAIANGGILRPPHVIDRVGGRKVAGKAGTRVISEATAASLRSMLEGVLGPSGTASGAAIEGYQMAGKTGTAEKADKGGYSKTKYVSSFVGFAPAKRPKLLVAVMVDEPQGDIYGGKVAAPAFRAITSFALGYLKIAPE